MAKQPAITKAVHAAPECPTCRGSLMHDTWEDMFSCRRCHLFFYPEDVGRVTNRFAPIFREPANG
jgi:hypothetical protein